MCNISRKRVLFLWRLHIQASVHLRSQAPEQNDVHHDVQHVPQKPMTLRIKSIENTIDKYLAHWHE